MIFILCIIAEVQSTPTFTNSYHEWEGKDNITHAASFWWSRLCRNDAALQIYLSVMYATTSINTTVFWDVMIYSLVNRYWNFRGTSLFHLQDRGHLTDIVQHITHKKDFKDHWEEIGKTTEAFWTVVVTDYILILTFVKMLT